MPARLKIVKTTSSAGGPTMGFGKFDQATSRQCGERFIHLGHPWVANTPATLTIVDGNKRRKCIVPRNHGGHVLGIWLADTTLSMVISDVFHVVHGVAITEVDVRGAKANWAPVRRLRNAKRHIGKSHAELSLESVMRRGDQLFALAGAGYRYQALLELVSSGKSYTARVVMHAKADQAQFTADGDYVVFHVSGKTTTIVGLDGTRLATLTAPIPKSAGRTYLASAANGRLTYAASNHGKSRVFEVSTAPWPATATGELVAVPASAAIADLPIATAKSCSPEPTSYATTAALPVAFGAVTGWILNADPEIKKPTITHAIITDLIINFFAAKQGKLKFVFNFSLAAIDAVKRTKIKAAVRVEISTPSGKTVLHTTRAFADALADAV